MRVPDWPAFNCIRPVTSRASASGDSRQVLPTAPPTPRRPSPAFPSLHFSKYCKRSITRTHAHNNNRIMSDSSSDAKPSAAIPSWQTASASETSKPTAAADKLEVARRFLEEDQVKSESREKQVAFLKTKGVSDDNIEKLLSDTPAATITTEAEV